MLIENLLNLQHSSLRFFVYNWLSESVSMRKFKYLHVKAKLSMKLFIDLSYTGTGSIISETYSVSILSRSPENCSSHNHSITTVSNLDSKLKKLLTSNKFLWIRIVFLPKTTEALRSMSKKLENKIITSINLIPLNTSFEC